MAVAQVIDLSALMLVLPLVVVMHLAYRAALDRANDRLEHLARIASYATALRATADGVLIIGRDRQTTFMNAAGERLTGWTEPHAIGHHVAEVLQTLDAASGRRRDPLTTDEGPLHDYLLLDRAGRQRPIEVMHASIRNEAGEISGAILTFRDVSERLAANAERDALLQREQRARVAADAASRLKDEFLTTLSHELRTPATSILGWVRVLRTGRMGSANIEPALEALERSAKAQAALIEDLLDVSRIVSGTLRLALQAANVPDLLAAAVAVLRPGADAKGVNLSVQVADGVPSVQADPARLQQVFWNLLSNAIKFTDRGGAVDARVGVDTHAVIVEIRDTGRGIDPAALPFIFDRFRQADGSSTRSHGGLGLGLSIVRHITEAHGGMVNAVSQGAGKAPASASDCRSLLKPVVAGPPTMIRQLPQMTVSRNHSSNHARAISTLQSAERDAGDCAAAGSDCGEELRFGEFNRRATRPRASRSPNRIAIACGVDWKPAASGDSRDRSEIRLHSAYVTRPWKINPDPTTDVKWGDQTWERMMIGSGVGGRRAAGVSIREWWPFLLKGQDVGPDMYRQNALVAGTQGCNLGGEIRS